MWRWFQLVLGSHADPDPPACREFAKKRLIGFEPTTFCMAIRPVTEASGKQICPVAGVSSRRGCRPLSANARGYASICGDLGTSPQKCPKAQGRVPFPKDGDHRPRRCGSLANGECP